MDRLRTSKELAAVKAKSVKRSFLHHLTQHGHKALAEKITECGEPISRDNVTYFARHRCKSVYCVNCFKGYVAKQTEAVRSLFDKYATEAEQRQNIVHLTIVFDAFRLSTKKGGLFVPTKPPPTAEFPAEYAEEALNDAREKLKHKLRHKFPKIGYAGAFEWEVYSDMTLDWRAHDKVAAIALLGPDATRDPRFTDAQAHIVLFHAHIVVDLNGTSKDEFRNWMKDEFPKRLGIPVHDTIHISSLRADRTIEESIQCLARYPLKTYLHYKRPNWTHPYLRIDGEVVAELAAFRSQIRWQQIKISKKSKS